MWKEVVGWGHGWEGMENKSENLRIYLVFSTYLALWSWTRYSPRLPGL